MAYIKPEDQPIVKTPPVNQTPQDYLASGGALSNGQIPSSNNEPITAGSLTPVPSLNIAPATPFTIPNVKNLEITEPQKQPQMDFAANLSAISSRIDAFKPDDIKSGLTEQADRQLLEINKQIRMHQADALQAQEKALASGETLSFASGEAQRVARNDAIEAIRLSAIAEAAQGNVNLAEKQATRAVNAQFEQLEKDARIARQNILNNYDSLSASDKKRADAALLKLDAKDAFVAEQKAAVKEAQTETIKYSGVADPATLDEMSKAGSAVAVQAIAARKGLKTLEQQKLEKDLQDDLQFIQGTANQPAGTFNKKTGVFTPTGGSGIDTAVTQSKVEQADFLLDTVRSAQKLAHASGPSGLSKMLGDTFVGDTAFRRLETVTNTLRTSMLTLATDPDIKKFFGPQMSNADVKLMTSAGTTLNPEQQSPEDINYELARLENLFVRMRAALPQKPIGAVNEDDPLGLFN